MTAFDASMDWTSRIRRRFRRERIARDFARYSASRPLGFEIFSDDRSEYGDELVKHLPPCDAINLHWIARYVDYERFLSTVPKRVPVVWTIHDTNPITGGCHYDESCGSGPQLGSGDVNNSSRQMSKRKQELIGYVDTCRLHFVSFNRWMASNLAQDPFPLRFPITIIPNGLDTEVFAPWNRKFAREVLGLPQDATIILFVASQGQIRYKGFLPLIEALSGLKRQDNLLLASVGTKPILNVGVPNVHLGQISDDRLLAQIDSAEDLFVIPSLQDNSPNTVLESMACGVPGSLVRRNDVAALRAGIEDFLRDPSKREEMGINSRRVALQEYSPAVQARRYSEMHQSLV